MDNSLWTKVLAFDIDDPLSEYGFSTRLAHENAWTITFTQQAILEYKKFMFLAATGDTMVSPSEIVDIVWHQHLIFTQSYSQFCKVLDKRIEHIPSTHNRQEKEKFDAAKENTRRRYEENFGEQPEEIWECNTMLESFPLPKSKSGISKRLAILLIVFVFLIIPTYILLEPVYQNIDNPYFLITYCLLSLLTFGILYAHNKDRMFELTARIKTSSFMCKLQPEEMMFFKKGRLSFAVHSLMNKMVLDQKINVSSDYMLTPGANALPTNAMEFTVLDYLQNNGNSNYPDLLKEMVRKPVFTNIENSIQQIKNHFESSRFFIRLFSLNVIVLCITLLPGIARYLTGIDREKPVLFIGICLIAYIIASIVFLVRLKNYSLGNHLPPFYEQQILYQLPEEEKSNWQYCLSGNAALAASVIPMVIYSEGLQNENRSSSSGCSGGGDGGGSGNCGGGCGGCGGGGD